MTDPIERLRELGADVTTPPETYRAAHERLLQATSEEAARAQGIGRRRRAARRPRRRSSRLLGALVPAAAVAIAAAFIVLLAGGGDRRPTAEPVPAAALRMADKLTRAPDLPRRPTGRLDQDSAQALVRRLEASLPYPPGRRDDLSSVLDQRRAPQSRTFYASEAESTAQYRAWCSWLSYWSDRRAASDPDNAQRAEQVIAAATGWPALRTGSLARTSERMAHATATGQAAEVRQQVQTNCLSAF